VTIVVFGAGGVGAFFGGLLARAGQDVRFIARGAQLEALRTTGIQIASTSLGLVSVAPVQVSARAAEVGVADLVLICVKAHQTPAILDDVAQLVGEHTTLVTLQNGVESDDVVAARFGRTRVIPAVVYVGATLDRPGHVSHVAAGTITLGIPTGATRARVDAAREALAATGLPVGVSDDIDRERWRKLLWNASFNTVSAVTGRDPARLLAVPESRALLIAVMKEVVAVAVAQGIQLQDADVDAQISWTERAGTIRTSTAVDRERGREMETDALIGVVVRRGRLHGVPTPSCEAMLGVLRAMETPLPDHEIQTSRPMRQ